MLNAAWRGIREGRSAAGNGFAAPAQSVGIATHAKSILDYRFDF